MAPSARVIVAGAAAIGAVLVIAAACKRAARDRHDEAAARTGVALAEKPFYRLDAGPPAACTAASVCEARVVLTALGAYHVNKDYPFKFLPDPAQPLEGEPVFALDDATHGTMTLRFRPSAPGTATVAGTFKLSVCSDDTCEIEKPAIALRVAVK